MTLKELFENAHLEALGMLDAAEQAEFEAAFRAAPEGVRAQIRAEQSRWAGGLHLPDVEPSANLKERVLAAVGTAKLVAELSESAGVEDMGLRPARRVSRWWRVAAVSLAACSVALGGAFYVVNDMRNKIFESNESAAFYESGRMVFGREPVATKHLNDALLEDMTKVVFSRTPSAKQGNFDGAAAILTRPEWDGDARLVYRLPRQDGMEYRLVEVDEADAVISTPKTFEADGTIQSLVLRSPAKGTRLALVCVRRGSSVVDVSTAVLRVVI